MCVRVMRMRKGLLHRFLAIPLPESLFNVRVHVCACIPAKGLNKPECRRVRETIRVSTPLNKYTVVIRRALRLLFQVPLSPTQSPNDLAHIFFSRDRIMASRISKGIRALSGPGKHIYQFHQS